MKLVKILLVLAVLALCAAATLLLTYGLGCGLIALAGAPEGTFEANWSKVYFLWPAALLVFALTLSADVLGQAGNDKSARTPGRYTFIAFTWYALPIILNGAHVLSHRTGHPVLAETLYASRWVSQPIIMAMAIIAICIAFTSHSSARARQALPTP
jgi:hypothetical protein